jgi:hypothetical protein
VSRPAGTALARLNGPMIDAASALQPPLGWRLLLVATACLFAGRRGPRRRDALALTLSVRERVRVKG